MGLIDTHTHLESFHRSGDLEGALTRAWEAGLESVVTIGTHPDDWSLYRSLAQRHPGKVHYTVGLHPCSVDERWPEAVAEIEAFGYEPPYPVALGECGLDRFHLPKEDEAKATKIFLWQKAAFAAQLALAKRIDCPLVVHSRGAFDECVAMIDASGVNWTKVVFHCFTEGVEQMEALRQRGAFGSFTGVLTYKSAQNVRDAAKAQGLARFMLETDAPYLTPMPHRGKPNEPAYLVHTASVAAELFGVSVQEVEAASTACAKAFYRL